MSGEGEFENSLEYTPTWVMAGVCAVFFIISYPVVCFVNFLRDFVVKHQEPIYLALQVVITAIWEELALTGLISVFLPYGGKYLTKISVPPSVLHYDKLWPCSPADHLKAEAERQYPTTSRKVPLLSAEALHQIHIFVILLGAVYFIFSFIIFLSGTVTIKCWKKYNAFTNQHRGNFIQDLKRKYDDFQQSSNITMAVCQSFFKQFIGFVTESDYMAFAFGFCNVHDGYNFQYGLKQFHKEISSSHETNFGQTVGISWYLWAFVIVFLFINVHGWHAYFWISFIPFIPLIIMGTILELVVNRNALKISQACSNYVQTRNYIVVDARVPTPRIILFFFDRRSLFLKLIHFILYQNAYQMAIFMWIGITFGFDSCMMEQLYHPVPKLIIGVFILGLCGFSSLPLYTIATERIIDTE